MRERANEHNERPDRADEPDGRGSSGAEIRGFRVLLGAGAAVYGLLGVSGLFFTGLLHGVLGPDVDAGVGGFLGMARLYGALALAVGVGYVVGAIDPMRNRGLLFVLFAVPLLTGVAGIVAAAKSEVSSAKGALFAAFNLAYLLLYFRLYPKPAIPEEETSSTRGEASGAPDRASESREAESRGAASSSSEDEDGEGQSSSDEST